jgi:hypothetical protein
MRCEVDRFSEARRVAGYFGAGTTRAVSSLARRRISGSETRVGSTIWKKTYSSRANADLLERRHGDEQGEHDHDVPVAGFAGGEVRAAGLASSVEAPGVAAAPPVPEESCATARPCRGARAPAR